MSLTLIAHAIIVIPPSKYAYANRSEAIQMNEKQEKKEGWKTKECVLGTRGNEMNEKGHKKL